MPKSSQISIDIFSSKWMAPTTFPDLSSGVKAIDLETNDIGIQTDIGPGWCFADDVLAGKIIGVAVAHESGFSGYYPIGHDCGDNFDADTVFAWLRHVTSSGRVVMHNASYDLGWLQRANVTPAPSTEIFDTYIASVLARWSSRHHNLDATAQDLGISGKNKDVLYTAASLQGISRDKIMSNLAKLPPSAVGVYAEADAVATLMIAPILRTLLSRHNLQQVFALETEIMRATIDMRFRGVRVDQSRCGKLISEFKHALADNLSEIKHLTGIDMSIWQADSVAQALAETGLQCPKTTMGHPSVTKEMLTGAAGCGNRVATLALSARAFDKAMQFVTNIRRCAVHDRIHAEFHPLWSDKGGARTGRFSSSNPNMQNIPSRDKEIAPLIRRLFLPEDGAQWDCFDFASQEPRITVHWACHKNLAKADDARQQYLRDNSHDFHAWAANLFSRPRKQAKALFLGTVYCKGGASLCDELGLPTIWVVPPRWDEEVPHDTDGAVRVAGAAGASLRRAFDDELPFVRGLQRACVEYAKREKHIKTISGRRVPIRSGEEHKAINYMIQGSAADQMKRAIVACRAAGYTARLTVHDDNNFCDLPNDAARAEVKEIMEHCTDDWFVVPSKIDLESGPTWGDIS